MASQRKRKYGSIAEPSEDALNESLKSLNDSSEQGTSTTEDEEDEQNYDGGTVLFYDRIHGHFTLPKVLTKIIDTPHFQRLRNISQMGGASYVFTGATHTRFQHCLGTAHLAGRLCTALQQRQPLLDISPKDILCVQIAGLCHDIGYGPFSKLFDKSFLKRTRPDCKWSHEDGSIALFDHMWKANDLGSVFQDYLNDQDIVFIKEMIQGNPLDGEDTSSWSFKGRPASKSFLYQIVSNKTSGVDVDKFDYLARDSFHLGLQSTFHQDRYIESARVIQCDDQYHICTRDKDARMMYELFHTRLLLQRTAVCHKTVRAIKLMLADVLVKADAYVRIPGEGAKRFRMSECIDDMDAFLKLNDNVLTLIETLTPQDSSLRLREAQDILKRIQKRDLYTYIGEKVLRHPLKNEEKLCVKLNEIFKWVTQKDDFVVVFERFDYGMKEVNPVDQLWFYTKSEPDVGVRVKRGDLSNMLTSVYCEHVVRVYSKKTDHFFNVRMRETFREFSLWCDDQSVGVAGSDDSGVNGGGGDVATNDRGSIINGVMGRER